MGCVSDSTACCAVRPGARAPEAVFVGNDALPGGNKAPSIRPAALRERDRTVSNLAYALRTGVTPSGDAFGGSMGEVVMYGTSFLSPADLEAMATCLLNSEVENVSLFARLDEGAPNAPAIIES